MTPRERLLRTLRGREADRVPLMPLGLAYATPEALEAERDELKREIARRVYPHTAVAFRWPSHVNRWLVTPPRAIREVRRTEGPGGDVTHEYEIRTPKGPLTAVTRWGADSETLWTVKYPVESLDDLAKLRSVPWETPEEVVPPDLARRPPTFAERGYVETRISSPFVCVAGAMAYERFLELCATHLDLMKELTQECLRRTRAVLGALLAERSVELVWIGGCEWLTPPMASPRLYAELVQEPERALIETCHQAGALVQVHCHGKVGTTLERVIQRGADYFEPVEPPPDGDVEFAEAKRRAGGRMTLGGNIEARVLANETPDAVERAARKAFEGGRHRMVLATSVGPLGRVTPAMRANYHRLVDVWEALSPP